MSSNNNNNNKKAVSASGGGGARVGKLSAAQAGLVSLAGAGSGSGSGSGSESVKVVKPRKNKEIDALRTRLSDSSAELAEAMEQLTQVERTLMELTHRRETPPGGGPAVWVRRGHTELLPLRRQIEMLEDRQQRFSGRVSTLEWIQRNTHLKLSSLLFKRQTGGQSIEIKDPRRRPEPENQKRCNRPNFARNV